MPSTTPHISRTERFLKGFSVFLRVSVFASIAISLVLGRWWLAFESALAFVTFMAPALIERNFKVSLPTEFELIISLFLYASLFLGEIQGFYTRFWWWDIALHTGSGFILGFVAFLILYSLYSYHRISMNPFLLAVFTFSFSMAIGTLWEIFEFAMDQLFGMNLQKSGLMDTMWDLIVDAIGALSAAVLGSLYVVTKKSPIGLFDQLILKFVAVNKQHFSPKNKRS